MSREIDPFGAALERAMNQKNLSVDGLAAETGIPPVMLRMHLAGKHRPAPERIVRIEGALELAPGTLADIPLPLAVHKRPF
jgi:Helix-turn-helix